MIKILKSIFLHFLVLLKWLHGDINIWTQDGWISTKIRMNNAECYICDPEHAFWEDIYILAVTVGQSGKKGWNPMKIVNSLAKKS